MAILIIFFHNCSVEKKMFGYIDIINNLIQTFIFYVIKSYVYIPIRTRENIPV